MVVDRHSKHIASRLVDETEAIALSLNHVSDREGDQGSTVEATSAVDCSSVTDGDDTGGDVVCK